MSVTAVVSPAIAKEVRALLPVWALAMVGLGGSFVLGENVPLGLIAYGVGVLALGAQSIGHEYSYGTLPLLLAQPVDRRWLLLGKAGVLVAALLTVVAAASVVFPFAYGPGYTDANRLVALGLPVIGALFLAPWLTMVCRSVLAGVVFSLGLPGVAIVSVNVLVSSIGTPVDVTAMRLAAVLVLCAVTGVLGWRRFMRLEAIAASPRSLGLPRMLGTARPRHPLWALALKELHLQQLTFALVAVYLMIWIGLIAEQRIRPDASEVPLEALTPVYLLAMALLVGALASAEERQLGMTDAQRMLPIAAAHQWMVKIAVVFGLAAIFAIALPALLGWINGATGGPSEAFRAQVALLAIAATASGLYISSLCRSGVQAAVLSIAIVPTALSYYLLVLTRTSEWITWLVVGHIYVNPGRWVERASTFVLVALVAGLLVRLAYTNHRTADATSRRIVRQALIIVVCLAGLSLLQAGASVVMTAR